MTWEELIAEFRALGGIAENVRLAHGARGRGIFVIDPAKPATLHVPENLLIPSASVEVREGQLAVRADAPVGERERTFFENFARHFAWGEGMYESLTRAQEAWSALPAPVIAYLSSMGGIADPAERFSPPTPELCLRRFCESRESRRSGAPARLLPVVDLVNHSARAASYVMQDGIGVTGTFADEMLVRYNLSDTWTFAVHYSFFERSLYAHSLSLALDLTSGQRISITGGFGATQPLGTTWGPRKEIVDKEIRLSYLTLGDTSSPDLPRAIFRRVMEPEFAPPQADQLFDYIAHFNRAKFFALFHLLDAYDGELVRMLRQAVIAQLEVLNDCVGAREL